MRNSIKTILRIGVFLLFAVVVASSSAFASQKLIEADGSYQVGDGLEENHATAKERARTSALRHASEEAALYLESFSTEEMGHLTKDEIRTLSAAVLQVKETRFQPEVVGNTIVYRCHVVVVVDTDNVMNEVMKDKQTLAQNLEKTKEIEQLLKEKDKQIEELKRQYAEAKTEQERENIRAEAKENDALYPFTVKLKEALQTGTLGNYADATKLYNQIIYGLRDNGSAEAEKILALAYIFRGNNELVSLSDAFGKGELMELSDSPKLPGIMNDAEMAERILQKLHRTPKTALQDDKQHNYKGYIYVQSLKIEVYRHMKNYPMVMKLLDALERDVPTHYSTDVLRARLYLQMEKHDEALKFANAVISKEPRLSEGYEVRGSVYMGKEQYGLALEDFNKAIGINPKVILYRMKRAFTCIGMLVENLEERDWKKKRLIAQKVLPYIEEDEAYLPNNYMAMEGKGLALIFLGRDEEAFQILDKLTVMEFASDDVKENVQLFRSAADELIADRKKHPENW